MNAPIVLKNFGGVPEITADAFTLKREAIDAARPIARVENPEQQLAAVAALQKLKDVRGGMESTRKTVKAPVLALGRKIDEIAHGFIADVDRQYMRLTGMISHYQKKLLREKAAEQDKIESQETRATQLRAHVARLRLQGQHEQADKAEAEAFDLEMNTELAVAPGAPRPRGLVVKNRITFQVLDAIVFCQAWPDYWKWHADTETLKLDRMKILDELNREGGGGFHRTRFPEELAQGDDRRLVQPAGLRVYEETKTHIR